MNTHLHSLEEINNRMGQLLVGGFGSDCQALRADLVLANVAIGEQAPEFAVPAVEVARRILSILQFDVTDPIFPRSQARILWAEGHLEEAVDVLNDARRVVPLGDQAEMLKQLAEYHQYFSENPRCPHHLSAGEERLQVLRGAAQAYLANDQGESVQYLLSLLALQHACSIEGRLLESLAVCEKIVELVPRLFPPEELMKDEIFVTFGNLLQICGRSQEAIQTLGATLNRNQYVIDALFFLARVPGVAAKFTPDQVTSFELLHQTLESDTRLRRDWPHYDYKLVSGAFGLGDICDALGDFSRAFTWYQKGNELQRGQLIPFSLSDFKESDLLGPRAIYERLKVSSVAPSFTGLKPIFIIGAPRSGTSLLEKMLSTRCDPVSGAHDIFPAGELDIIRKIHSLLLRRGPGGAYEPELLQQLVEHAGQAFLGRIPEADRAHTKYIVDKQPNNLLNLGVVQTFFPDAIIIECVRDPVETLLSMYFHNFASSTMTHCTRLEDLAAYHREVHVPAIDYWRRHLPNRIVTVKMEDLVSDPEGTMEAICKQAGLRWFGVDQRRVQEYPTATEPKIRKPIRVTSRTYSERYPEAAAKLKKLLSE